MARTMGDASKVRIAGGDGSNLYYFYTGESSYRDNSIDNIAAFAQEHFDSCKGKSVEDIEAKHIFWGTEGGGYKGFYNGDTYVLFDDVEKLPQDVKQDALANCKGYRDLQVQSDDQPEKKVEEKTAVPSEFDPVQIRRISPKCVREMQRQDGNGVYYRVGISVDKSISENGFANISVSPSVIEKYKGTYTLNYPDNHDVPARVVRNGKSVTEPMVLSDLAESHQKVLDSLANRRLPDVPKEAESTNELSLG